MAFELPPLPYAYDALEPVIDEQTMRTHHGKHHATYVENLNNAVAGSAFEDMAVTDILNKLYTVPDEIRAAVRNNGGGHANHSFFWETMGPNGGGDSFRRAGRTRSPTPTAVLTNVRDKFNACCRKPLWQWMGLARCQAGRQSAHLQHAQSGRTVYADRGCSAPGAGRMGTCLLLEVSEPARRICQQLVECDQLGCGGRALRGGRRLAKRYDDPSSLLWNFFPVGPYSGPACSCHVVQP